MDSITKSSVLQRFARYTLCYDWVMKKSEKEVPVRTWVEIDTKAIAHNYRIFRKLLTKKTRLMGIVKSNAYGHNITEYAKELERLGVDALGVDSLVEALALRKQGIKSPILVLGYTIPELFDSARAQDIAVTISTFESLAIALKSTNTKKPLRVHLKIDTGMHRQGFQSHEIEQLLLELKKNIKQIIIEGVYTHFAEAKEPRSGTNTRAQIASFNKVIALLREDGLTFLAHASATGGTLLYPSAHYDMVRIGIGLYGLWPSKESEQFLGKKIILKPVLSWRAIVSEVKQVQGGERVGYDYTEMLTRNSRLAIIPVGYWHGFPRMLSARGRVLVCGKTARVIGRVSMDMIVVDVTDIPEATVGSVATMIGKDKQEQIHARELAEFSATTHYEIVTRLNPLMRKDYI